MSENVILFSRYLYFWPRLFVAAEMNFNCLVFHVKTSEFAPFSWRFAPREYTERSQRDKSYGIRLLLWGGSAVLFFLYIFKVIVSVPNIEIRILKIKKKWLRGVHMYVHMHTFAFRNGVYNLIIIQSYH